MVVHLLFAAVNSRTTTMKNTKGCKDLGKREKIFSPVMYTGIG